MIMGKRGPQPSVFDPMVTEPLLALIREGHFPRTACGVVGIGYSTFRRWVKDGRNGKTPTHEAFAIEVAKARAHAEAEDLRQLKMDKSWQSCAWRLERRNHKHWGRKDKSDVIVTPPKASTPEEVADEIRKVLAELENGPNSREIEDFGGQVSENITTSGYQG